MNKLSNNKKTHCLLLLAMVFVLGLSSSAFAINWYVTPTGSGGGLTTGDPTSLTFALANADPGDDILLEEGTYTATPYVPSTNTLTLTGGYETGTAFASRDAWNNPSVIDAEGSGRCVDIDENVASLNFNGLQFYRAGDGALQINQLPATFTDCKFSSNTKSSDGAAINAPEAWSRGLLTLDSCVFDENVAAGRGGAVRVTNNGVVITNCLFTRNVVNGDYEAGALHIHNAGNSTCFVVNNTFSSNTVNRSSAGDINGLALYVEVPWNDNVDNSQISNNIFTYNTGTNGGNDTVLYHKDSANAGSTQSNLFWGNTATAALCNEPMKYTVVADPGFVDGPYNDLRLTDSSNALDIGVVFPEVPSVDFLNNSRFVQAWYADDTFPDAGAYELQNYGGETRDPNPVFAAPAARGNGLGGDWANAAAYADAANLMRPNVTPGIYLSEGTYYNTTPTLTSAITMVGSFDATLTGTETTGNDRELYPTIFDGQNQNVIIDFDPPNGEITTLSLTSINLVNGYNAGRGGGMLIGDDGSDLPVGIFTDCKFENCRTGDDSGVFDANGDVRTLTFIDCLFYDNYAHDQGGVIYVDIPEWGNDISTMTFTNCVITSNSAGFGSGTGDGGFLRTDRPKDRLWLLMENCEVTSNTAADDGGAIYAEGITIYSTNTLFAYNVSGDDYACIGNNRNQFTMHAWGSTFMSNRGGDEGGSIRHWSGADVDLQLYGCYFTDEKAAYSPFIHISPVNGTVEFNLIVENCVMTSGTGSGWSNSIIRVSHGGNLTMTEGSRIANNTFAWNDTNRGIACDSSIGGVDVYNNIFAHNTTGAEVIHTARSLSNCLFFDHNQNLWNGGNVDTVSSDTLIPSGTFSDRVGVDPLFVNDVQGGTPDDFKLSYAVGSISPAIDAGTSMGLVPATDYFGTARPKDGDIDGTADWDMGAYEFFPQPAIGYTSPFDLGGALNGVLTTGALTVSNTGVAPLNISAVNLQSGDSNFSVVSFDSTIDAGSSGEIVFGITSSVEGMTSATFWIMSDDSGSPSPVDVWADVLGAPSLEVTVNLPPWSIDHQDGWAGGFANYLSFRNVLAGQSRTLSYELRAEAISDDVVIEAPAPYSVSIDNVNFFNDLSLTPVGYIVDETVYVKFAPTAPGFYFGDDSGQFQTYVVDNTVAAESLASVVSLGGFSGIALPAYEPFDYATGELVTASNNTYVEASSGTGDTSSVIDGNLVYPGLVPPSGRSVALTSGSKNAQAPFYPSLSSETLAASDGLYYSMLLRANELPGAASTDGKQVFSLLMDKSNYNHFPNQGWAQNSLSMWERGTLVARATDAGFELGVSTRFNDVDNTAWWPTELTAGTTYFIVVQYHPSDDHPANDKSTPVATSDTVTLWVNPTVGAADPALETSVTYEWQTGDEIMDQDCEMNGWVLHNTLNFDSGDAIFQIDEVNIGQSWAEVNEEYTGPQIWYVDDDATAPMDGLSWDTAFDTITSGVAEAGDGDMVWVAAGTYPEKGLNLADGASMYGGFAGTEGPFFDLTQRDIAANESIVDGTGVSGGAVVDFQGGAQNNRLDGFTFQNWTKGGFGGIIPIVGGSDNITIANCKFFNLRGQLGGSGITVNGAVGANGTVLVDNCEFTSLTYSNNWAGGSAIVNNDPGADITVTDSSFTSCGAAASSTNGWGGAIDISGGGGMTIDACSFVGNGWTRQTAGLTWGGAIALRSNAASSVYVTNSFFSQNVASTHGSAIGTDGEGNQITAINCSFDNNGPDEMVKSNKANTQAILINCLFTNSPSQAAVGANGGGTVEMTNCYFFGNASDWNTGDTDITETDSFTTLGDPLYKNAAIGDLHVADNSPVIDLGTSTSAPTTDIDGQERIGLPDIGADEIVPPTSVDNGIWTLY
ncbi:MAG: choice-of-anchor Q domain-containing protein [Candidatus Sumerlaeia bacterium]